MIRKVHVHGMCVFGADGYDECLRLIPAVPLEWMGKCKDPCNAEWPMHFCSAKCPRERASGQSWKMGEIHRFCHTFLRFYLKTVVPLSGNCCAGGLTVPRAQRSSATTKVLIWMEGDGIFEKICGKFAYENDFPFHILPTTIKGANLALAEVKCPIYKESGGKRLKRSTNTNTK